MDTINLKDGTKLEPVKSVESVAELDNGEKVYLTEKTEINTETIEALASSYQDLMLKLENTVRERDVNTKRITDLQIIIDEIQTDIKKVIEKVNAIDPDYKLDQPV